MTQVDCSHGRLVANGISFHYVEAGKGPLVLLLHGFPEFWYSWRHQLPALSAAGFRAVALDMRGYNLSGKPVGVKGYRLQTLIDDAVGVIEALGERQAVLVGHDWGGMVAWAVAMHRPDVVSKFVAMNAPHPKAYSIGVKNPAQALRSWYMGFFTIPKLPEMAIRAGGFAMVERILRTEPVRAGAFSDEDIALYKQALDQPGALTSAINYYRAMMRDTASRRLLFADVVVDCPSLLLWGDEDRYLRPELADMSRAWALGLEVLHLPASHWVQNDAVDAVNERLVGFLA